jgi:hypothetical protein
MHSPDIPEPVLHFIAEKIDTVPQLEALLLMWGDPSRAWQCEELAARIYVRQEICSEILQTLQRRELIAGEGSPPTYRYNPAWDAKGELMTQLAETYRRHLVQVATFIHSRGPSSVREFARAFDFKKDR